MCICQSCGKKYSVDIIVPDKLWEQIKPKGKPEGAGLLCGKCIMDRIENIGKYDCYYLSKANHG
jgi:hypothetical protein